MTSIYVLNSMDGSGNGESLMEGAFLQIEDAKVYARLEMWADVTKRDYFIEEWVGGTHLSTTFVQAEDRNDGCALVAVSV